MPAGATITVALLAALVGALLGCLSGLVPGLHSNNVAIVLAALSAPLIAVITLGIFEPDRGGTALVVSAAIVACAIAHTVANIVPSIFLAAPEGDTALTVLPGHRMLLAGRGLDALRVSVASSLVALLACMLLLLPMRMAFAPPMDLHGRLRPWLGPGLLLVSALMIASERHRASSGRRVLSPHVACAAALLIFLGAGALGYSVVFADGALLTGGRGAYGGFAALFIGLFGLPTIILAIAKPPTMPPLQGDEGDAGEAGLSLSAVLRGTVAGAVVGWFPGISSAQATILAVSRRDGDGGDSIRGASRFIAGVSAVNTANVVFNLVALATFLRVRSGAAAAVLSLSSWPAAPWEYGIMPPFDVTVLLLAAAVGGVVAAPVTLITGRFVSRMASRLAERRVLLTVLLVLTGCCWAFGGNAAFLVLVVSTALGLVPPLIGLMRVHLMGSITLPLALGLIAIFT
jgi:putative membrane protein